MNQKGFMLFFLIIGIAIFGIGYSFYYFSPKGLTIGLKIPPSPSPVDEYASVITPTPSATPKAKAPYNLGVIVIKYFPLTGENNLDKSVTGDIGESYDFIRKRTLSVTNNLKSDLENASKYLGYKNPSAPPSLTYTMVDNFEYKKAVPFNPTTRKPLYKKIMEDHNICNLVNNKNVREVWIWAYQGPTYPGSTYPYLNISESKMAGPFGDISNSHREADMPVCKHTYRVYTFNYGRETAEAIESWGHQMEVELDAMDRDLFRNKFQGPAFPQTSGETGRCGTVHNPPNARFEYDRENSIPHKSDCLDWKPEGLGTISNISCSNWGGCVSDGDNSTARRFQVWYWQNLPGLNNDKTYKGKKLRNWWDVHGNFDEVMANSKRLTE